MHNRLPILVGAAVVVVLGSCSSPPPTISRLHVPPGVAVTGRPSPPPALRELASSFDTMRVWTPRYISTGISTGIMVEFGGMKKGKSVNARYAILDVWRYPVVSGVSPEHRSSDLRSDSTASAFVRLFATINDLRQAFFKTSAGRYVIRHVTSWADERYIRDVIVREGSYSIVTVNVLQAPPTAGMNE